MHTSLGHAGVDKCVWEINQSFHLKNAGRKVHKLIASCDICQRVKHPNRSVDIQERSHVPSKPGELCSEPFRTQRTRSDVQGCPFSNSFTRLRHKVSEMKTHPHTYYNFLIKTKNVIDKIHKSVKTK